jgi:hypothetical protein
MNIQNILFKSIRPAKEWKYRIDSNDNILKKSLKIKGVLSPLIVLQGKNQFLLLDGFKRYQYIKNHSNQKIPSYVYSKNQAKDAFLHSLLLNETNRPLSTIEKSNVVKLIQIFDDKDFRNKICNFLGIPVKPQFIQKFLTINLFNETAKKYFHNFQFSLRQIDRISALHINTLIPWIKVAQLLNLKAQEFISIVETIWDISINDKIPIDKLYHKLHIEHRLNTGLTNQQKSAHLKTFLHQKRYPILSQIQEKVAEQAANIEKKSNLPVRIFWDKNLEQSGYWLNIYLDNEDSLHNLKELFESPKSNSDFKKLFKIIIKNLEDSDETS